MVLPRLLGAQPAETPVDADRELTALARKILPVTVSISVMMAPPRMASSLDPPGKRAIDRVPDQGMEGVGSGVLVTPEGHILTNYHVVGEGVVISVMLSDGRIFTARRLGIDRQGDVALIKITGREPFPCADFGDSEALRRGQWAAAVGNPWVTALADGRPSLTLGVISGLHRYEGEGFVYGDAIQIDAPINPGSSGGPLFDLEGRLIGINGKIHTRRGRRNSGIGYAVTIRQIEYFLEDLKAGQEVFHGMAGLRLEDEPSMSMGGARVVEVASASPADQAGIKVGDRVVSCDGRPVRQASDLVSALSVYPAGREVFLEIRRGDQTWPFAVRLAKRSVSR
jgi:S1-C subfamily serine protease